MKIKKTDYDNFYKMFGYIICTEQFQSLKNYIQHGNTTLYDHCINVALRAYKKGLKKKNINLISLTKGALLHDFFLYDWHDKNKGFRFHGYKHPKIAVQNAKTHFNISTIEKDIIINHMFPLTLFHMPKSKEAWIVCYYDKICSFKETLRINSKIEVL